MKYIVSGEIISKYPDLRVGVLVGRNLKIGQKNAELSKLINKNTDSFLAKMYNKDILSHPNINAWREAYKSFGVKPKDHKPTAEALLRRVLNEKPFPRINDAVDAYLAVELLYLLPVGGYDLSRINGDIVLRISQGGEKFFPIGGGEPEETKMAEVVYSDNSRVLTRRWNYRDADFSKITEESKDILLASEAVYNDISDSDLQGTINTIVDYLTLFCGGTYVIKYLSAANFEVEL